MSIGGKDIWIVGGNFCTSWQTREVGKKTEPCVRCQNTSKQESMEEELLETEEARWVLGTKEHDTRNKQFSNSILCYTVG